MTITATILVLISAFTHAGWNFFGKQSVPTLAFFFLVMLIGSVLFSPVIIWQWPLVKAFDSTIIGFLLLTGLFQAIYLWGLAEAYRAGDMSVAYPIARSSPLIIVCISTFFLTQQSNISAQAVLGIIFIVVGCLLLPLSSFTELRLANYCNRTTLFALIAACATAGYSLVDDHTTRLMRALTSGNGEPVTSATEIALSYVVLQSMSSLLWMAGFVFRSRMSRRHFYELARHKYRLGLLTATLMLGTYALVILSMAFVDNVSYVVAFRQLSIPLGVLFAVLGLNESLKPPKQAGVLMTFIGLVAVALG